MPWSLGSLKGPGTRGSESVPKKHLLQQQTNQTETEGEPRAESGQRAGQEGQPSHPARSTQERQKNPHVGKVLRCPLPAPQTSPGFQEQTGRSSRGREGAGQGGPHTAPPRLTSPWRLVLGEGLKKLCRTESSVLKSALSFSTMYCFSSGETSSPKSAWLSCQICRFTSTAQARYSSLSAITSFSFFSGTYITHRPPSAAPCPGGLPQDNRQASASPQQRPHPAQPN